MLLFLVGYMAAGKSSMGRQLASNLGCRFVDTDEWVESRMCMTVREIFEQHGEPFFRLKEKECIEFLMGQENIVIATGGGLPCFNDLMMLMNDLGLTIYFKLPTEALAGRIWNERDKRPLVSSISSKEVLVEFVDSHLKSREEVYNQATEIIEVNDYSQIDLCAYITKLIR